MKHTPGPWEYHQTDDGHEIRMGEAILSPYNHDVELVIFYEHGLYPDLDSKQYVTAEANARLIAAAPELLEALEEVLEAFTTDVSELHEYQLEAVKKAQGIIEKAKGGAEDERD